MKYRDIMILERKIIINFHITEQQLEEFTASFIFAYATSQTQCLQGTESSFSLGDCARVAEHPVDVRLATTEAERRPDTPPLGANLLERN